MGSPYIVKLHILQFSVYSIRTERVPGSAAAWPASDTIVNFASGQALCSSHAEVAGQTTSYLPWTMNPVCGEFLRRFLRASSEFQRRHYL